MTLKNYSTLSDIDISKKYVLAFSGGPDSAFLFFHLLKFIDKKNLIVAHVNYHLRKESDYAEKLVREYCEKNEIKYFIHSVEKKDNQNLENWARKERYIFFEKIIKKNNFDYLLVAHTLEDDIETYALQKKRGSIVSYYGLKDITIIFKTTVIRPMLKISKKEILSFLKINNISYDYDASNDDEKFERNKIRKKMNEEIISDLSKEKNSKNRMIKIAYKKIMPMIKKEINLSDFRTLNDKEELVFIFEYLKTYIPNWDLENIKKSITTEIAKQLRSEKSFIKINVNKDFCIIKDRSIAFVFREDKIKKTVEVKEKTSLKKCEGFLNYEEIYDYFILEGSVIVSNDFIEYQSKLNYKGKKIKEHFLKHKTSYKWKLENAIIYKDDKSNNILNKTI